MDSTDTISAIYKHGITFKVKYLFPEVVSLEKELQVEKFHKIRSLIKGIEFEYVCTEPKETIQDSQYIVLVPFDDGKLAFKIYYSIT